MKKKNESPVRAFKVMQVATGVALPKDIRIGIKQAE